MTTMTSALQIRMLSDGEDPHLFPALARLLADAYPIMELDTTEDLAAFTERLRKLVANPDSHWAIALRDGTLVGAMALYDYTMNVRGRDTATGGVGSVAVSLAHRKQGIARAMVAWYLEHYRERGATFAVLHPFRPDFYRAMGFGYGTPMQRFRFTPSALRADAARGTARFLGSDDIDALHDCYERVRARTNGLIAKHREATERAFGNPALRYVGIEEDGMLRGFMQTSVHVDKAHVNRNELIVRDLCYEEDAHLAALLGYLRSQNDQFSHIVIETQEAAFYLAASDPRDGSDRTVAPPAAHRVAATGLGIMYRILDVEEALGHLPAVETPFALRVEVEDAFMPLVGGVRTFRFGPHGAPRRDDDARPDATLTIGVHDLSSLVMGSLRLADVVRHRLATLEPAARLGQIDAALRTVEPPMCTTRF